MVADNKGAEDRDVSHRQDDDIAHDDEMRLISVDPVTERARQAQKTPRLPVGTIYANEQEPDRAQFSIRHVLILQAGLAVLLGLTHLIAPSLVAGALGITGMFLAILIAVYDPEDKRVTIAIWVFILFYLLACTVALLAD